MTIILFLTERILVDLVDSPRVEDHLVVANDLFDFAVLLDVEVVQTVVGWASFVFA